MSKHCPVCLGFKDIDAHVIPLPMKLAFFTKYLGKKRYGWISNGDQFWEAKTMPIQIIIAGSLCKIGCLLVLESASINKLLSVCLPGIHATQRNTQTHQTRKLRHTHTHTTTTYTTIQLDIWPCIIYWHRSRESMTLTTLNVLLFIQRARFFDYCNANELNNKKKTNWAAAADSLSGIYTHTHTHVY